MSAANNETTPQRALQVGLIAEPERIGALGAAIRGCSHLHLATQAGPRQSEALPDVPWYDDTRVMIAQGELDALVLDTSTRAGVELGATAIKHGIHVWRTPPLGRSFAEATEVVHNARRQPVVYHVVSWWDHLAECVSSARRATGLSSVNLSEIQVSAAGPPLKSWRSSLVDAGGGVLLTDAYAPLEILLALRGLPEGVLAAIGNFRRPSGEGPRETEDVANAILRYAGGGLACVRATWDTLPYERCSRHHGGEVTLTLSDAHLAIAGLDGECRHEGTIPDNLLAVEMDWFAGTILGGEPARKETAALDRHIATTALLDAIYLSARTGQPESPRKLYRVQGWPEPKS
ncbi:MAG: hypothetical protein KKB50_16580 [Planctomycetes bacterium]|nr:hypothetical protein [Planctomycetota bacterium]